MDKQEAEQRAQELIDFYGSGAYKAPNYCDWETIRDQSGEDPMELTDKPNERDTHFQGAAELLETDLAELLDVYFDSPAATEEQIRAATRLRIAQFLFDFGNHLFRQTDFFSWDAYSKSPIELIEEETPIPDMTELPERKEG